jgi:thioredoxin-like negative regulator of GroEL
LASGLNVKQIPALFVIYKGSVVDSFTGFDPQKIEELVQTALLVDQAANDEQLMVDIIKKAENAIADGHYAEALQVLQDSWSYEQWRS